MPSEKTNTGSAGGGTGYTGPELSCRELVELVTAYREGALAAEERVRFEAHLAICPPCVRYVEQLDLTVRAVGDLNEEIEQASSTQELLTLFRSWKAGSQGPADRSGE